VKQEKAVVQKSENSTQPAASANAIAEQNSTAIADYEMYTVKKGDNVGSIAQKFDGVSGDDIIQLNNIKNVRGLSVGQKLKIPKKS
jgi:membrane-bound lytic murein transglycosylase D